MRYRPTPATQFLIPLALLAVLLLGACETDDPTNPQPPPRIISVNDSVGVDQTVTLVAVAEDEKQRPLTYEIDWGDSRGVQTVADVESGLYQEFQWQYFDPGSYMLRCRVTNSDGRISAWTDPVSIVVTGTARIGRGDWWMFMRDPQHSGHSRFQGPSVPVQKWEAQIGSPIRSGAVYDIAGSMYFGGDDFRLHAYYADGRQKWQYSTGGARIPNTPALGEDGALYFGSSSANVYRVNRHGRREWNVSVNAPIISSSATLDRNGRIYIGSEDNILYCLNTDGSLAWRVFTTGPIRGGPALSLDETRIYVGSDDRLLYAVTSSGEVEWTAVTDAPISGSPSVGGDGTVFVGSADHTLYAFRPDGALRWKRDLRSPIYTTPAVTRDGRILVATSEGKLFCLHENGGMLWSTAFAPSGGLASPIVDVQGTVFIGSPDGRFTAISSTGRILWRLETEWPINVTASIGQDGSIGVGNDNGLYFVVRER